MRPEEQSIILIFQGTLLKSKEEETKYMDMPHAPVEIFCFSADADMALLKQLEQHLSQGIITTWHTCQILAGANREEEIERRIETAAVILLLVSPALLASDYGYSVEMQRAMQRHEANEARVIPLLLRPVDWQSTPFGKLQALPRNRKPLTRWENRDAAFVEIVQGIRAVLEELKRLSVSSPAASFPKIWQIPAQRNPFFTGRDHLLSRLHTTFQKETAQALTQAQAISGLGGIGKTQLAVEYAYRHRQDYQCVLWSRADTLEALITGYVEIAIELKLSQKDEQDQMLTVQAVIQWLRTHRGWLLILDNADDLKVVHTFLPPAYEGHLLLTTRAQVVGAIAQRQEVEILNQEMGALLLLRRAQVIAANAHLEQAPAEEVTTARAIAGELGGLPLALDQAGAFIEETQCGLADYRQRYQRQQARLLARRGGVVPEHPEPVATTWALSFEKVKQADPMAAELLQFCAFLAPDEIPEELLIQAIASGLNAQCAEQAERSSPFSSIFSEQQEELSQEELAWKIDDAVAVLRAYSLIQRKASEKMFSVHRLVQAVVRGAIEEREQEAWITCLINAVEAIFPTVEFRTWEQCVRYLPQALACAELITQKNLTQLAGASLLKEIGAYFFEHGQYQKAEPLLKQALEIRELQPQSEVGARLHIAACLNNLAALYDMQGRYSEAESLLKRALDIFEQSIEASPIFIASCLNNLTGLYKHQKRYREAEPLLKRALEISEEQSGAQHPNTATSLHNLAGLYEDLGRYAEAEPLLKRALEISEEHLGAQHPDTARSLRDLAGLYYRHQGRNTEAEPILKRAVAICEEQLGGEHPDTARSLSSLATLYYWQKRYAEAEPLYERALEISEEHLGAQHPETATNLSNLARFYKDKGRYAEAESLWKRALAICEQQPGSGSLTDIMERLDDLAKLYYAQRRYAEAELLLQHSLSIHEQVWGRDHPRTQVVRANCSLLLQAMGREQVVESKPVAERKKRPGSRKRGRGVKGGK